MLSGVESGLCQGPHQAPRSVALSLLLYYPCVSALGAKSTYAASPMLARGMRMAMGAAPTPSSTPCYNVLWGGQDGGHGVTLLALVPERGRSPEP